jgi:hypothetical protein
MTVGGEWGRVTWIVRLVARPVCYRPAPVHGNRCWEVGVDFGREPQRYFFMHIPKTAGMTLYHRLIRHY